MGGEREHWSWQSELGWEHETDDTDAAAGGTSGGWPDVDASGNGDASTASQARDSQGELGGVAQGLVPAAGGPLTPVAREIEAPVIIPGTGRIRRNPFIRRRARPLTMRLVIITLMACIVVTGILAVTPLSGGTEGPSISFQALSGMIVWRQGVGYRWYSVNWGDTVDSIATQFHVQIGGIYELNNLYAGQEVTEGQALKIPSDPTYGASYHPPSLETNGTGQRFGPNWWDSVAGNPPPESLCGPDGRGTPTAYKLAPPNWGAYWVRGFIVIGTWIYHTGVDLAAPQGNPIRAAQAGQVIWAGYDATNGLGWSVKIDHCHHISTVYGHMLAIRVAAGTFVKAGDVVGLEGSTGSSTGPHLHFMVEWNNQYVDPMPYYAYSKLAITKNTTYG